MERWGRDLYGDPCRECGWDWAVSTDEALALVAGLPSEYRRLLDGGDGVCRHPDLGWTAASYVCHVADNLRNWAERLAGAALADVLDVAGYDADALGAARQYNAIPAEPALWTLGNAVRDWQTAVVLARGREVVLRHATRGDLHVDDVVATNAHDAYHHGWDIRRTLTSTAAARGHAGVELRERTSGDHEELVGLIQLVHETDDYPARLPADLSAFIDDPGAAAAWVAVLDGRVVGHVALHHHTAPGVLELASATLDRPRDELVVVARLLVHPAHRRQRVGAALLARATDTAQRSGRVAVLDVAMCYPRAIALYERTGWRRLGTVTVDLGLGSPVAEHVYAHPREPRRV